MKKFIVSWVLASSLFSLNYCFAQKKLEEQKVAIQTILSEREKELDDQYWIELGKSYYYKIDMLLEGGLSIALMTFFINELRQGQARVKKDKIVTSDSSAADADNGKSAHLGKLSKTHWTVIPFVLKIAGATFGASIALRALYQFVKQVYLSYLHEDTKAIARKEAEEATLKAEKDFHERMMLLFEKWQEANPGQTLDTASATIL